MSWLRRQLGADVEWLPYDLHPEYPPQGIARAELVARYGDHFQDAVRSMAETSGLPFNPHPDRVPNTRQALELSEWARTLGAESHERLHERVMDAYWAESRDIGQLEELVACATDVGLDSGEARSTIESGRFREVVDTWTAWAQVRGISAIPAFVFDGRLLVSGAVPHDVLERAAERVRVSDDPPTAEEG